MHIKYVTPLHIPLTWIKSEFKCINNFDPTFDARQIEIKQLWLRLWRASKVDQIYVIFDSKQTWLHRESNAAFVTCDSNQR